MLKINVTIQELKVYFEKYKFLKDVTQSDLNYLLNINIISNAVKESKYKGLYEGKRINNLKVLKYIPRIKHNWGVLYLCQCLICGDLFLVHCEKIADNSYKCCYKDSCIQNSKIEKIKISGFSLPKDFKNTDIVKIVDFLNNKYLGVINYNFKYLRCLGLDKNKNGNFYVKIEIECQKCGTLRTCSYEIWKKSANELSCEGCNHILGIVKVPKKDNLRLSKKEEGYDLRYKNKVSNKYIYLGKWRISEGVQKIWIRCKDCSHILMVDGEEYLKDIVFDCYCNTKKEIVEKIKEPDTFTYFKGYIHYDETFKNKVIDSDKILYKIEGKPILKVECQKCGRTREVLEEEFLNERTKYFNSCICKGEKDTSIKIGDRLGHLTVKDINEDDIELICDCNNIVSYPLKKFKTLGNRVCSSHCTYPKFSSKYYDKKLVGMRFNDFVVKELLKRETISGDNPLGAYWLCECQKCGSVDTYFASEIYRNNKKSCCFGKKYYDLSLIGQDVNGIEIIDILKLKGNKFGTLWQCKCPYCGDFFVEQPLFILNESTTHCGCQSKTKGELSIDTFLKKIDIEKYCDLYYQYSFKDLKSDKNTRLRYDFALIDKVTKKIFLIEYDGPQHDDINSVIGAKSLEEAKEIFELTKKHDLMKDNYALKNNYPLLRIKDTRSRKIIEEYIISFLKENDLFRR